MPESEARLCEFCEIEIPHERLEALPDTTTCVKCSTEEAYHGFMVFDHKTAPSLMKVKPKKDPEAFRQMLRAHNRDR